MPIDFSNPAAFAPLYGDLVAVEGSRPDGRTSGTYRACVFDDGLEDPLSAMAVESNRRVLSVHIPKVGPGGWNDTQPPQVGDTLTIPAGVSFSIERVGDFADAWLLTARQTA